MQNKKRLIFAHRGLYGGKVPENSLSAFRNAAEAGLGIEFDVRLTKDGIPVVFHDKTLRRMCGDKRKLSSLTFDELQKFHLNDTEEHIPALEQVLDAAAGITPLLIETKLPRRLLQNRILERRMLVLLKNYNGAYMLQSFNSGSMKYMKKRLPEIECGILSGKFYPEPGGFDFVSYKLSELTSEKSAELHEKYPQVLAWSSSPITEDECRVAMDRFVLAGIII